VFPPKPKPEDDAAAELQAQLDAAEKVDKVYLWRYRRFAAAGFTSEQALSLAYDRGVDSHRAVSLAERAGPALAYSILS
jgi:hypothetical protein